MSDLRKAAQDVVDAYNVPVVTIETENALIDGMNALRAAMQQPAPDDAVCEWTRYIGGGTTISCKPAHFWFLSDTNDWRFCQNCGKRIRFIDAAMQQEQSNGAKPVA